MKSPSWVPVPQVGLCLATVAGALQALSIAWPGTGQAHGWLQVASLALLASGLVRLAFPNLRWRPSVASLLADEIPLPLVLKAVAWRTVAFAVAWLAGTFWWLHVSMHQVGGLPAPLSVTAVLLLALASLTAVTVMALPLSLASRPLVAATLRSVPVVPLLVPPASTAVAVSLVTAKVPLRVS